MGSGQPIADPFLALFRQIFWQDGPPTIQGGIFTALWAIKHACEVNPGGIKEPVHIAVLAHDESGKLKARMLTAEELAEHDNIVSDATRFFASYREIMEGSGAATLPDPPKG